MNIDKSGSLLDSKLGRSLTGRSFTSPPSERNKPECPENLQKTLFSETGSTYSPVLRTAIRRTERQRFVIFKEITHFHCFVGILSVAVAIVAIAIALTTSAPIFNSFNRFPNFPDRPDRPEGSKELFEDIAGKIVPEVEDFFFRGSDARGIIERVGTTPISIANTTKLNCTSIVYGWYLDQVNGTVTDPEYMSKALSFTTLQNNPTVLSAMEPYLTEPQDVTSMFTKSQTCSGQNDFIAKAACSLVESEDFHVSFHEGLNESYLLGFHVGVMMEVLTSESLKNDDLWKEIFTHVVRLVWDAALNNVDFGSTEFRDFAKRKINSVMQAMNRLLNLRDFNYDQHEFILLLWLNIMETTYEDYRTGILYDNVIASMVLIYNVNGRFIYENGTVKWPLTKEWVDLYIAWNLAYAERFQVLNFIHTLFLPSVICSRDSRNAEDFFLARVVSLGLNLAVRFATTSEDVKTWSMRSNDLPLALMRHQGAINVEGTSLRVGGVSDRRWEEVFRSLLPNRDDIDWRATDTSPLHYMNDADYKLFIQLVVTITVIMTGLGLEIHAGPKIIDYLKFERTGIWWWMLAQFLFPFLCIIAIICKSPFGLPFLVLGLWKLGFPETIVYATNSVGAAMRGDRIGATTNFMNSLGLFLHHSASAYVVVSISLHYWILTRHLSSLLLILVIQHWFSLIKYYKNSVYFVIEFFLEVWWEWEFISNFEHFVRDKDRYYDVLGPAVAVCMLFAHWLFLASAMLELLAQTKTNSEKEGLDHLLTESINRYNLGLQPV